MPGITITADNGSTFHTGVTQFTSIKRLSDNTFVVAYQDNGDANKGKVIIGTRIATTISVNEANTVTFSSHDIAHLEVIVMSSSLIVICYRDITESRLKAIAGSISGTTITFGTAVDLEATAWGLSINGFALDSTNFIVSTGVGQTLVSQWVGSVSGTTVTMGGTYGLYEGGYNVLCHDSRRLNATEFITGIGTSESGTVTRFYIGFVDVVTKIITYSAVSTISAISVEDIKVGSFDELHCMVFYKLSGGTGYNVIAGSINDITHVITFGTPVTTAVNISYLGFDIMDSTHFIVSFEDNDNANKGKVRAGTFTPSTTVTWDADGAQIYDNSATVYTSVCKLTSNYFIVGYQET